MRLAMIATLTLCLGFSLPAIADDNDDDKDKTAAALNFKMTSIDGDEVNLADYQGKVVVMVNVASRCGMTPQYADLQELHEKYSDQGLAILGFPCNQFGGQEPGTEADIKTFCTENYGVEFDMFSKIEVNGDGQSPLYAHLTRLDTKPTGAGDVRWNFEKFVLDRKGNVIARYGSRTKPTSDEFIGVIEKALAEK